MKSAVHVAALVVCLTSLALFVSGCGVSHLPGKMKIKTSDSDSGGHELEEVRGTTIDVEPKGPYGSKSLNLDAGAYWQNTGLFLKTGETATITASGKWRLKNSEYGPDGDSASAKQRGCNVASLVARIGLGFEDELYCVGPAATVSAKKDGVLYIGMVTSTDNGEFYGDRLAANGSLTVTIQSEAQTVPTIRVQDLDKFDLAAVASRQVEVAGKYILIAAPVDVVERDRAQVAAALDTLDRIYESEAKLRGMRPFKGHKIRFVEDPSVIKFGYMIAGNPIRTIPDLFHGHDNQRILRAAVPETDIWGFAHELGHTFTVANGAWTYQQLNLESWPNIFSIHALEAIGRTEHQPNIGTYCNNKDTYLAHGSYETLKKDPFIQLCYLMEFKQDYG